MGTFLNQQTSITIYLLQTKENKLPFSVSVCSKQMEVAVCIFIQIRIYTLHIYTYIHVYMFIYTYIYMLPFQTEN
jgi:hypothetical protein